MIAVVSLSLSAAAPPQKTSRATTTERPAQTSTSTSITTTTTTTTSNNVDIKCAGIAVVDDGQLFKNCTFLRPLIETTTTYVTPSVVTYENSASITLNDHASGRFNQNAGRIEQNQSIEDDNTDRH